MKLKTLIADDHPLIREGIQNVVQHIDAEHIILQAVDFSEAQKIMSQHADIDLIIVDLCMPAMNGASSLSELRRKKPSTPIVVISASDNINDIRSSINNGANGYIHKSSSNDVMLNALRLILSGGLYLPPQWTQENDTDKEDINSVLTPRQIEVINLLAFGKANKEIAREFSISDKTVKAHLSEIFKRLKVDNRTQAVYHAKKLGIIRAI